MFVCAFAYTSGFADESIQPKATEGQLACYSPNGNFFAYVDAQNSLQIESLRSRRQVNVGRVAELFELLDSERFHQRNQAFLELRRLGSIVETQLSERLATENSLEVQERLKALQHAIHDSARSVPRRRVRRVLFSPNDEFVAVAGDRVVTIWRATSQQQERIITSFDSKIHSLAFSSDGYWLAIGTGNGEIFLYDMRLAILYESLNGHQSAVTDLAFSADQRFLYSAGGSDKRLGIWNTEELGASAQFGKRHVTWLTGHTDTVVCLAVSPDGKQIVSGGYDHSLIVWDADSHSQVTKLEGHSDTVRSIVFTADGKHLVSGGEDQSVRLWDLSASRCIAMLNPGVAGIQHISLRPQSNQIAVSGVNGDDNRTVTRQWDDLQAVVQ
jgi:WD40 repeat protein